MKVAETAINTMEEIYNHDNIEDIILVDTSNAFNSMKRQAAPHNIPYICPPLATLHRHIPGSLTLFKTGEDESLSKDGTKQGNNLAMSFYDFGTDSASGVGTLYKLREWWGIIISEGQNIGYSVYANPGQF